MGSGDRTRRQCRQSIERMPSHELEWDFTAVISLFLKAVFISQAWQVKTPAQSVEANLEEVW